MRPRSGRKNTHCRQIQSLLELLGKISSVCHKNKNQFSISGSALRNSIDTSVFTFHLLRELKKALRSKAGATIGSLFDAVSRNLADEGLPPPTKFGIEAGSVQIVPGKMRRRGTTRRVELAKGISPYPMEELSTGDDARFVGDLNYPDGTSLPIDSLIVKSWEIRNTGIVPWRHRYLHVVGASRGTGLIEVPPLVPVPDTDPAIT